MSLLKLEAISKQFGNGDNITPVLHDVSFEVNHGEFITIMGPSGSGKSTLMNVLGLLDTPTSGDYLLDEHNIADLTSKKQADLRNEKIGFIFQSFNLLPRQTALDNITLPLIYSKLHRLDREKIGHDLLEKVGLTNRGLYKPPQLSGGQKQRVAIARALANKPSLILADEPTGNLDTATGKKIMELISDLNKQGNTIVVVTHDSKLADYSNRIIELVDGRIVSDKKTVKSKTKSKKAPKKSAKKKTVISVKKDKK